MIEQNSNRNGPKGVREDEKIEKHCLTVSLKTPQQQRAERRPEANNFSREPVVRLPRYFRMLPVRKTASVHFSTQAREICLYIVQFYISLTQYDW